MFNVGRVAEWFNTGKIPLLRLFLSVPVASHLKNQWFAVEIVTSRAAPSCSVLSSSLANPLANRVAHNLHFVEIKIKRGREGPFPYPSDARVLVQIKGADGQVRLSSVYEPTAAE